MLIGSNIDKLWKSFRQKLDFCYPLPSVKLCEANSMARSETACFGKFLAFYK